MADNISDRVHALMLQFAARAAFALHYEFCREVVPTGGGVFVRWFTNESLIKEDFPHDFTDMLGPHQTLRQGKRTSAGQFDYRSAATDDNRLSAHRASFRGSFAIQVYVARVIADLNPATKREGLVYRPGFLKESVKG